jgi:hypothetical protein
VGVAVVEVVEVVVLGVGAGVEVLGVGAVVLGVVADLRLLQLESLRQSQVWANQRWRSEFVEPSLVLLLGLPLAM